MSRLRVHCFSVSVDGFGAGPNQCLEHPLGEGGLALHEWAFATREFQRVHGLEGGSTGVDDGFMVRGFSRIGAWILGRNMFGPIRGTWPDDNWKGWWGEDPPYHVPVFVLTHHARPPVAMAGGTTFHFVTGGLAEALAQAREAAAGLDVRLGGGVATVRQALVDGLVDEMHVAVSPVLLGRGEALFAGLDLPALGYQRSEQSSGEGALHLVFTRQAAPA
jgi:dihydrofolate reductase